LRTASIVKDRNGTVTLVILTGVLSVVGALVSGCSIRVPESEVNGVYVADYENGTEKLTLEKNGKYSQEVRLKGSGKPVTKSGTWKYVPTGDGGIVTRIHLEDCLGVNDGFGKIRPDFATNRGGCSFPVERRWFIVGRLRLGPNEASPLWKMQ
jgi:hypothetical protein